MEQDLEGKAAVVTGAAQGIGRTIATTLAARGALVLVADIDHQGGRQTVDIIATAGGTATFAPCDVTEASDMEVTMDQAKQEFGRLDVLVNNAGTEGQIAPLCDYDDVEFERVFAITSRSVYLGTKYAARVMRGVGNGGHIINIASVAGLVGLSNGIAYSGAKHAAIGMTKTAALDLAEFNIRVNAVCPGIIRSRMASEPVQALGGASMAELAHTIHPIGRIGEPSEVAELVAWLASGRSTFCTGAEFKVDGGYVAR